MSFRVQCLPVLSATGCTIVSPDTWSVTGASCACSAHSSLSPVQQVLQSNPRDSNTLFIALKHNTTGQQMVAVPMPWPPDKPLTALQVCYVHGHVLVTWKAAVGVFSPRARSGFNACTAGLP
jgi:hypothetical protein